jgi:hypothetical protein
MGGGMLTRMLLGPCCTREAVLVTAAAVETPARCACKGGEATVCAKCADKRASRPDGWEKGIAQKLRLFAAAYAKAGNTERASGLEMAADVVEAAKRGAT